MPEYWEGYEKRECTEHRTTGGRAWCFDCTEWCYESLPCRGCELPLLREKLAKIEALAVQHYVVDEGPDAMGFSTLVRTPFVRKAELDAILGDDDA